MDSVRLWSSIWIHLFQHVVFIYFFLLHRPEATAGRRSEATGQRPNQTGWYDEGAGDGSEQPQLHHEYETLKFVLVCLDYQGLSPLFSVVSFLFLRCDSGDRRRKASSRSGEHHGHTSQRCPASHSRAAGPMAADLRRRQRHQRRHQQSPDGGQQDG